MREEIRQGYRRWRLHLALGAWLGMAVSAAQLSREESVTAFAIMMGVFASIGVLVAFIDGKPRKRRERI